MLYTVAQCAPNLRVAFRRYPFYQQVFAGRFSYCLHTIELSGLMIGALCRALAICQAVHARYEGLSSVVSEKVILSNGISTR